MALESNLFIPPMYMVLIFPSDACIREDGQMITCIREKGIVDLIDRAAEGSIPPVHQRGMRNFRLHKLVSRCSKTNLEFLMDTFSARPEQYAPRQAPQSAGRTTPG